MRGPPCRNPVVSFFPRMDPWLPAISIEWVGPSPPGKESISCTKGITPPKTNSFKTWFGKGNSFETSQFLVSMLDFWGVKKMIFPFPKICWVVPLPSNSDHQDHCIFRIGDPYKPSFATITGKGDNLKDMLVRRVPLFQTRIYKKTHFELNIRSRPFK